MTNEANRERVISVIGLGYVGLPVAVCFAEAGYRVIGYDIDPGRIADLSAGRDRTGTVARERLAAPGLGFSNDEADLQDADVHIVAVPTPIDGAKRPDLRPFERAAETVGRRLKRGAVAVFESTVFPGATEEVAVPILERLSGLACGRDFQVGYSPERINPGDPSRDFTAIAKIVAGNSPDTTQMLAELYGSVVTAGIHQAASIRIAEAAKVIENTQRDLNIALVNELSVLFHGLGIDTRDVLEAAGTKWNFLPFQPGLVGGHCIGVDPYYLTHKAHEIGHVPQVVLAGRGTNEAMPAFIATAIVQECARMALPMPLTVTVLGVTYKANVPDTRNSKVVGLVRELEKFGAEVQVIDPLADPHETRAEYALDLVPADEARPTDAVVLAVPHTVAGALPGWDFVTAHLKDTRGFVADIPGILPRETKPHGITLWRL